VWTDGVSIGQDRMAFPIQIKLKKSLTVSTPKNNISSSLRDMRAYAYYKFLKITRATN
jgi:hypothetical protein